MITDFDNTMTRDKIDGKFAEASFTVLEKVKES